MGRGRLVGFPQGKVRCPIPTRGGRGEEADRCRATREFGLRAHRVGSVGTEPQRTPGRGDPPRCVLMERQTSSLLQSRGVPRRLAPYFWLGSLRSQAAAAVPSASRGALTLRLLNARKQRTRLYARRRNADVRSVELPTRVRLIGCEHLMKTSHCAISRGTTQF